MAKTRRKPPAEIYRNMSAIRSRDNRTEVALRGVLHRMGLRFRLHDARLAGRPDIVFPAGRVAVFVDGDFWHAREMLSSSGRKLPSRLVRLPRTSRDYWLAKFRRRIAIDKEATQTLRRAGWEVIRLWESDVRRNADAAAQYVRRRVIARRSLLATKKVL